MAKCAICDKRDGVIKASFPSKDELNDVQICVECLQERSVTNIICEYCGKAGNLVTQGPIEALFVSDISHCKVECMCDDCYVLALKFQMAYSQQAADSRLERPEAIASLKRKLKSQQGK